MTVYRPRIFISSTISDFKDLRSSLKYYLEEFGFQVLLSEYNDFEKPLDENSIQACIEAIKSTDIYILLIGSRAGGIFSKKEKTTITQYEYRNAYDLFTKGQIRTIFFVRDEIWKLKGDRKSLSVCIDSKKYKKLSQEEKKEIINHDSSYIEDTELIFEFIDEVAKTNEMKKAVSGEVEFPKGNWIHSFSKFSDIIDVLKVELNIRYDLGRIAREVSLKRELASNLEKIIAKISNGRMFFAIFYTSNVKKYLPESVDIDICTLPSKEVIRIIMFSLYSTEGNNFSSQFLDRAVESGDYLEFDVEGSDFRPSDIHNLLIELKIHLNNAKSQSSYMPQVFDEFFNKYKKLADCQQEVLVETLLLGKILCYANVIQNITNISIVIYQAINGNKNILSELEVIPSSPFPVEAEKIDKEHFTVDEIQAILEKVSEQNNNQTNKEQRK